MKSAVRTVLIRLPIARFLLAAIRRRHREAEFRQSFKLFRDSYSETTDRGFALEWEDRYPCLDDKTASTPFDRHYVYHTAWAARILAKNKPSVHIDLASSLYFCSLVSAYVPVRFYDYRPPNLRLEGLQVGSADLTALPFENDSISSLSCMHVVEHVGLGRYGDPLDPDGDLKAISELKRVLAPNGTLLFVVPVGSPRIMFNAHRIYSYAQVLSYFEGFELREFALIPDTGATNGLLADATEDMVLTQQYGCGCFCFSKPMPTAHP
jgi:Caenorhabditis protein of unknown function, DUF268